MGISCQRSNMHFCLTVLVIVLLALCTPCQSFQDLLQIQNCLSAGSILKHENKRSPRRCFTQTLPRIQQSFISSRTCRRLRLSSNADDPSAVGSLQKPIYVPPEKEPESSNKANDPPYIKIGDIVRYYDLDGGKQEGEVLVGKVTYVSEKVVKGASESNNGNMKEWNVEVAKLDDVGDGYYSEPSSRKSTRSVVNLRSLAPVMASYVRSEDAFKVPTIKNDKTGLIEPKVSYSGYKIEGYQGPTTNVVINQQVLDNDMESYLQLKGDLIRDSVIAGLIGTVIAEAAKGTEDAICYALGAAAGTGYLYFLSLKTDTVGSSNAKFGVGLSNFRFLLPFFVLLGISIRNIVTGVDDEILAQGRLLSTVKINQFADVTIGFLTYRIPLFIRQLKPLFSDATDLMVPGSAGIALEVMKENAAGDIASIAGAADVRQELKPVLLVSGPNGTGKTSLVNRLIADSNGRFVRPKLVDRIAEGAKYEIMETKGQILREIDPRYSLTAEGVLNAADTEKGQAVVIDADTDLAEKLKKVAGARIIGVWVGLDSLDKLKDRFRAQIDAKTIIIPPGESEESVIRGKIRKVVKDIEFGVVSGMFEFTILNDDFEESVKELQEAAEYCFK